MGGSAVRRKSPNASSQIRSPPVNAINTAPGPLHSSQSVTSLETHFDFPDSGDASKTKKREPINAFSIEGHRSGVAERLVSSRNTRDTLRRHHGFPNVWMTD